MKTVPVIWGLIVLVGFAATWWAEAAGSVTAAQAWIAWSIILFVLTWAVGKSMKSDKNSQTTWMVLMVFALIMGLVIAGTAMSGPAWVPLSWLASLWLLSLAAAKWTTMGGKDSTMGAIAILWAFSALFVGGWGANYWLITGLVLGLPAILHGLMEK